MLVLITTLQTIFGFMALNIENAIELGVFVAFRFISLCRDYNSILPLILYNILIKIIL